MKNFIRENWQWLIILLITAAFLISGLKRDLFSDWDECLYSVYAQEMKQSGNYLINQWNGYYDMQKPPLYSWLLQIPFLAGRNELFPRLLSVVAGLALITSVYFFAKKYLSKTIGIIACLLLLSVDIFLTYTQKLNTDIFYSLFIFLGFWLWLSSEKNHRLVTFSSLMFALAVMVKGLSVVSFLAAIFVSIFIRPNKKRLINFFLLVTILLLLIAPWHLVAYLKYGQDYLQIYFWENIVQRSRYPIEFHFGGRLYYFNQLFKQLFPWLIAALIFPLSYLHRWKRLIKIKTLTKELRSNQLLFLLLALIIIPLLAITKIKTKIAWYALPIYPFLVLFLGYNLELVIKKINKKVFSFTIMTLLIIDAFIFVNKMAGLAKGKVPISYRNKATIAANQHPFKDLYYLVAKPERIAKALLDQSPNLQIRSTFIYGGNPCAVYYSGKKVHYYYSTEEFIKQLVPKNRLFMIENGDLEILDSFLIKKIYQNKEFTLFELT